MMRLTKLADYGILLLTCLASAPAGELYNARDLAAKSRMPQPTVSKLLKVLMRAGLVGSRRGVRGGYVLARPADTISVAQIIGAIEGPIGVTECTTSPGACAMEEVCTLRPGWGRVNRVILSSLQGLTLAEMASRAPGELRGAR